MKLFIIGNGFDRNHGCETGYDSFKKYLQTHSYMIGDFELSHYCNGLDKNFGMILKMSLNTLILKSKCRIM